MNYIFGLIAALVSVTNICWAEDNVPAGCQSVMINGETLKLSAAKPSVFLIHNDSNSDLWVTHPVSNPSASAGWSSRLQAANWSALAVSEDNFELSCIESRPGHEQQVPCAGVISLCAWPAVGFPENSKGTYWAGEDMKLSALITYLGGRGFIVPAP